MMDLCGVTGWVEFDRDVEKDIDVVYKMTATLSNRGPDQTNYWSNTHVAIGHKRLAIVDFEGGKQPMMRVRNGRKYVLGYNGELYNTEELRRELQQRGYCFHGHSDTEVVLCSYIEWKEQCLERFNGIFAMIVWDEQAERVFIARDRLGVKPMFYKESNGQLLFGSEIKAILAHKDTEAVVTTEGLSELFALGPSRLPGSGLFKGIRELRPGHYMTFTRKGLKITQYWQLVSQPHSDNYEETVEKVRYLVKDAIERQLVSDVPLMTFLSGGLDSSTITAVAAEVYRARGRTLHTFSVDYEENEQHFVANEFQPNSDGYFIELLTKTHQTKHQNIVLTQEQIFSALEAATWARDLPGMADVDSSLIEFSKEIRKQFVVGLSGECADEIFAGYPWFYREEDLNRPNFPWIRSTAERQSLLRTEWHEKLNLAEFAQQAYQWIADETPQLEGESEIQQKQRILFYQNMHWFMQTLLDRKDRMGMGASIELRVPFADHRIVEYAWNIPMEMKLSGGREKGLLRDAVHDFLPTEINERKKSPYPKTHHPKYTALVQEKLATILQNKDSILHELFEKEKLHSLIETGGAIFQKPWYGQLMTGPQLLAYLIQIHYWAEQHRIRIEQ